MGAAGRGRGARPHTRGIAGELRSVARGVLAFELKACLCGFAITRRRRFGAHLPGVFIGFTCVRYGSIASAALSGRRPAAGRNWALRSGILWASQP